MSFGMTYVAPALPDFLAERLFEPLGMTHSTFITDRADDAAVFYGLQTTCLDLARFGEQTYAGFDLDDPTFYTWRNPG